MKWEKASILSLARKDSENNEVLDRFCPILPLLSKLIWSCLNPPPQKCSWRFQSHRCNFCTVLTVSGFKTKVIYSFSDKGFHLTEVCKVQVCTAWPGAPDVECSSLWCPFVEWCSLPRQSCSPSCELASAGRLCAQVPLQRAGSVCGFVCPAPSGPLWLLLAGHPSGTGCFELVCSEAERLCSSILYCTWLWATTGSCMLLLWPQGMNFSLSFTFGVFETTYMLDVLTVWTQGLYVKFHEDIFIEWKACWEVPNRLDRGERVTLSAFLPFWFLGTASGVMCSQNCA